MIYSGYDGNPCNQHINNLAAKVIEGVWEAGLVGYQFNVIGVSDGLSMGTSGMSFSLPSRDVIADSIETVSLLGEITRGIFNLSIQLNLNASFRS
jgi:dihydroxyacid dehydratase/phosphogluconate dehydratase